MQFGGGIAAVDGSGQVAFGGQDGIDIDIAEYLQLIEQMKVQRVIDGDGQKAVFVIYGDGLEFARHIFGELLQGFVGYGDDIEIDHRHVQPFAQGLEQVFFGDEAHLQDNVAQANALDLFLLLQCLLELLRGDHAFVDQKLTDGYIALIHIYPPLLTRSSRSVIMQVDSEKELTGVSGSIGVLFVLYGVVIASFLNVCIYRIPQKESVAAGRSYCPNCQHALCWRDLVPILSFVLLKGRCRYCHAPISLRYPVVEALGGVLFLGAYLRYGLSVKAIVFCAIFSLLIVISGIDLAVQEIPDGLNLLLAVCGVVLVVIDPSYPFLQALLGVVIVSLPLEVVALFTGGIGGGDVKLMAAMGLCLGPKLIVLAFFIGCVSAAVVSLALMAAKKVGRRSLIPLGPFLALGSAAAAFWGDGLISWYLTLF